VHSASFIIGVANQSKATRKRDIIYLLIEAGGGERAT